MENQLHLKKIGCSNCGAELIFDPGTQMTNCNFCGSKFEIEKAKDEDITTPDGILPFKISKEVYETSVLSWLSEGDYTPDDILNSTIFESVNGVYLPMWFFKGRYNGNWSASSGYNRREEYSEWSESQKKMVRKSRTVTDWRPSSGQCSGQYSILAFAGKGKGIKSDVAEYAHGTSFNRGELKSYDPKYTMGFNLIEYTLDEHDTWDTLGKSQANAIVTSDAQARVPGDKYKDFYVDALFDNEKPLRTYVPFWITNYKYNDKEFHVYMDGTSTSRIKGFRPEDSARKKEVSKKFYKGHILAVIVIIIFIIASNAPYNDKELLNTIAAWLLALTAILYGVGFYQKNKIIKESKERRQKILNNLTNGTTLDETEEVENKKIELGTSKLSSKFNKKYLLIGGIFILVLIIILFIKFKKTNDDNTNISSDTISTAPIASPNLIVDDTIAVDEATIMASESDDSSSGITEETVYNLINNYYSDLNVNNFDANQYFSQNVDNFINLKNTTPDEINNLFINTDFQDANSILIDDSLTFENSKEDLSYWSYWIKYSCYRASKNKYQECEVKIIIGLDDQMHIRSYKEVKVENLKFHL